MSNKEKTTGLTEFQEMLLKNCLQKIEENGLLQDADGVDLTDYLYDDDFEKVTDEQHENWMNDFIAIKDLIAEKTYFNYSQTDDSGNFCHMFFKDAQAVIEFAEYMTDSTNITDVARFIEDMPLDEKSAQEIKSLIVDKLADNDFYFEFSEYMDYGKTTKTGEECTCEEEGCDCYEFEKGDGLFNQKRTSDLFEALPFAEFKGESISRYMKSYWDFSENDRFSYDNGSILPFSELKQSLKNALTKEQKALEKKLHPRKKASVHEMCR